MKFDIVILGLSITSSWGNGHAVTYRSLVKGLAARNHRVLFLEHDKPWYARHRDDPQPEGATTRLYRNFDDLRRTYASAVRDARLVIVGSFVPEGAKVGEWVLSEALGAVAFYDIDTPVTLEKLAAGDLDYLTPELIRRYHCYLSFTGGPTLQLLESKYGSPMARPLYCSVDSARYYPEERPQLWDLAYLGTFSPDRQEGLHRLLIEPARRRPDESFAVAGSGYEDSVTWPDNVDYKPHLPPHEHALFYASQRFALNLTRAAMKRSGYSPSVRLFEAASCSVPIVSDWWEGLDTFFIPGEEILVADSTEEMMEHLHSLSDDQRRAIGAAARNRVLSEHTPMLRAMQIEAYLSELRVPSPQPSNVFCAAPPMAAGMEAKLL